MFYGRTPRPRTATGRRPGVSFSMSSAAEHIRKESFHGFLDCILCNTCSLAGPLALVQQQGGGPVRPSLWVLLLNTLEGSLLKRREFWIVFYVTHALWQDPSPSYSNRAAARCVLPHMSSAPEHIRNKSLKTHWFLDCFLCHTCSMAGPLALVQQQGGGPVRPSTWVLPRSSRHTRGRPQGKLYFSQSLSSLTFVIVLFDDLLFKKTRIYPG